MGGEVDWDQNLDLSAWSFMILCITECLFAIIAVIHGFTWLITSMVPLELLLKPQDLEYGLKNLHDSCI